MASRMDRYKTNNKNYANTRSAKNRKLYTSFDNNPTYTSLADVRNANTYSLSDKDTKKTTREAYQKTKDYGDFVETPKVKKELDDFNYVYKDNDKKIYDINTVIEEAKKNKAETENKKNKNNDYILTKEEIEKYKEEKREKPKLDEEDKVKELINTITSKTLRGEIDQATSVDLLSDLMATSKLDKVKNNEDILDTVALSKVKTEMDNFDPDNTEENKELKNVDNSFYTKSMDLSDKDFIMDDEFDDLDEDRIPLILKIILVLLIAALLATLVFFIVKSF